MCAVQSGEKKPVASYRGNERRENAFLQMKIKKYVPGTHYDKKVSFPEHNNCLKKLR